MVAMRTTERVSALRGTARQAIDMFMWSIIGQYNVRVDHNNVCEGLFEHVTDLEGFLHDRQQRLATMALREERLSGRIRYTYHISTKRVRQ